MEKANTKKRRNVRQGPLSRRAMLRGAAGGAVALPFLEAMLPSGASAQEVPKRFLVAYAGTSAGCDRGGENLLTPSGTGTNFTFRDGHAALRPLKEHVSVVSNLRFTYGGGVGQRPGGANDIHSRDGWCTILSGNNGYAVGDSVDVQVADKLGVSEETRTPLSVRIQAQSYRWNEPPRGQVSHRGGRLAEPFSSPQQLFDRLFKGQNTGSGEPVANDRLRRRRAVADLVHSEAKRLRDKLAHADRQRLEQHIGEIAALERRLGERLEANPTVAASSCTTVSDPGADPAAQFRSFTNNDGMNVAAGWSDEDRRADLITEMIRIAFACDYKRSVSLCMSYMQTFMSNAFIPGGGDPTDVHEASHGKASAQEYSVLLNWHAQKFANIITALRDTPEQDGTLLDHSALVLQYEGGYTRDNGGLARSHSHEGMVAVVAGHAGGLRGGTHIDAGEKNPCLVSATAMGAVGAGSQAGAVSGEITGLR